MEEEQHHLAPKQHNNLNGASGSTMFPLKEWNSARQQSWTASTAKP
jgi:hypothetical protein